MYLSITTLHEEIENQILICDDTEDECTALQDQCNKNMRQFGVAQKFKTLCYPVFGRIKTHAVRLRDPELILLI